MYKSKLTKVIVSLLRRVLGVTRSGAKRLMRAMLRSLMALGRRSRLPVAGFVLPTVTMVLLVVILLTVAIVLRSFDRANTARNVRVNQQVLAAATPALDRAKAKIQYMLYEDPQRPTATPSDAEMYRVMSTYTPGTSDLYSFGDEERLILKYPVINETSLTGTPDPKKPPLERLEAGGVQESEAINTAWRYPVDTNNDGKFDTFTLYGIFFRNPPLKVEANGDLNVARSRKPLDARTPPMALGALDPGCSAGGTDSIANLVGDSGWYKLDGKLRKSFFVYTVNVPIKDAAEAGTVRPDLGTALPFTGTASISALEYQQDQSRIPLSNNAVVYEDDLEISPGPPLNLNGRVLTNSNLLVSGTNDPKSVTLFQVSSKGSCFYDQENSKIQVAGNVVNGWTGSTSNIPVNVHLFKEITSSDQPNTGVPKIEPGSESVTDSSLEILYNSNAYSRRLNALVRGQIDSQPLTADPVSVQLLVNPPAGSTQQPLSRENALESYFKERLRKVPFKEAPLGSDGGVSDDPSVYPSYLAGNGDTLRPKQEWSFPTTTDTTVAPDKGSTAGPTGLTLVANQLPSRDPDKIKSTASETNLGERVLAGNNLPAQRWNDGKSKFLGATEKQEVDGSTQWADGGTRTRRSQLAKLADVGTTDRGNGFGENRPVNPDGSPPFRDGFWEAVAAQTPRNPLDGTGGLRVITSGGVYDRTNSFLPPPRWNDGDSDGATGSERGPVTADLAFSPANTYDDPATPDVETYPVVWPDTMPMSPLGPGSQVFNNTTNGPNPGDWTPWLSAWSSATDISATLPGAEASPTLLQTITEDPATARKYAKGDLRMRATAVYHYADNSYNPDSITGNLQPDQKPYACVSSYYDPSNASTARNITTLPADVSGQGADAPYRARRAAGLGTRQAFIGSNNGITYPANKTRSRPGASIVGPDGILTGGTDRVLEMQASLVFPDGRFANGPLRTALLVPDTSRTLAQKAAIDSTYCALDILSGATPDDTLIPHGAIQEVAFLNAREVKAIERDNFDTPNINEAFTLSGPIPLTNTTKLKYNYNQPLEERQPLEIRATQIDIDALRRDPPTGRSIAGERLLPNSGIIYASRDDALPDRSDRTPNKGNTGIDEATSKKVSPTDGILDPTRKPNGILLINGDYLFRGGDTPTSAGGNISNIVKEKGLILVSNLPTYIQGRFNPHGRIPPAAPGGPAPAFTEVEEFTSLVNSADWGNFYDRVKTERDSNFACREGDPRISSCGGDYWRPATVLADSITLLSARYRFGFRNEGDFDLRNNAGSEAVLRRRQRGFFNNNFVTNGLSSGAFSDNGNLMGTPSASGTALKDSYYSTEITSPLPVGPTSWPTSSYFNNFVTPVQRRVENVPEYLMEVCTKLPVSECADNDWVVNPLGGGQLASALVTTPYATPVDNSSSFQAGSTADPPLPALQRFPRRIAFKRDTASTPPNQLLNSSNPEPFALDGNNIVAVAAGSTPPAGTKPNTMWFAGLSGTNPDYANTNSLFTLQANLTDNPRPRDGSNAPIPALAAAPQEPPTSLLEGTQPLLTPFSQIQGVASTPSNLAGGLISRRTGWISWAENTTFNLIIGAGDTPSRNIDGTTGETNGGLQNLPRFLEAWNNQPTNIKGSFIQLNRSAFSTAPFLPILGATPPTSTPTDSMLSVFEQLSPAPQTLGISRRYNTDGNQGRMPYFIPPSRNWGYDVGLLPQPPDLFTQKFTTPPTRSQPAEFFREVPRNDPWVKTLMCGVRAESGQPATSSVTTAECNTFPY